MAAAFYTGILVKLHEHYTAAAGKHASKVYMAVPAEHTELMTRGKEKKKKRKPT